MPVMRRTVRIASPLNEGKLEAVASFLTEYNRCVNHFIERYWSERNFSDTYVDSTHMPPDGHFALTARLVQCAGKQALQVVKSQRMKPKRRRTMPRFTALTAELDGRFWCLADEHNSFEWVKVQSGFTFHLPFSKTAMWNKWTEKGFTISRSMRLLMPGGTLFMEFVFEKERPPEKTTGSVEGIDLGYVDAVTCSDGQVAGIDMNDFISSFGRRERNTHEQVKQKVFGELKNIDLSGVRALAIEDLRSVKSRTRGMFQRAHNRRLSHWLYARAVQWLEQRCEEQGIALMRVSPWKTSQFCRLCGNRDRRSRSGKVFRCIHCGHTDDADMNAAQNIRLLGLAGVYSLRSLPGRFIGDTRL